MGWPVISSAFHELPLFGLAANARLRLALCWFFAVLAGAVMQQLVEGRRTPAFVTVAAGATALAMAFWKNEFPNEQALEHAVLTTWPRALPLAGALAAALLAPRARRVAVGVLVPLAVLDLWSFGYPWNPVLPQKLLYPSTPLIERLSAEQRAADQGTAPPFRIAATGPTLFPNSPAMYGLEDIRSHDPMSYGRTLGALRVFTGYSSFDYFGVLKRFEDPFINYLNVKYLVTMKREEYTSDRFALVYDGPDGRIYQNRDWLPRFYPARNVLVEFDPQKRIKAIIDHRDWANLVILERIHTSLIDRVRADLLSHHRPEDSIATVKVAKNGDAAFRLTIDAPRWTLIVGSQPNFPGWKVYRNDEERLKIIEVNGAFIGFLVPPGRSVVDVVYRPRSFWYGSAVSLLTVVIFGTALVAKRAFIYP
jgi:hypothetical protein